MENLDLREILKDVPKGTKLYSPLFGECYLDNVNSRIELLDSKNNKVWLYYNGKYNQTYDGECMLFPSKENRDWSKFQRPFKDGDIVFYNNTIAMFKEWGDETLFKTYFTFYPDTKVIEFSFEINKPLFGKGVRKEIRFATEEEKQKLFDAIKANGYRWNAETKTLEKLVKPKFKIGDRVKKNKDYISGIVTDIFDDSFEVTYDYGGCSYVQFNYQCHWELVRDVPKFKVGDKICKKSDKHGWVKIARITNTCYIDEHCAFSIPIEKQDEWELYTIKFDISTLIPFESKVLVSDIGGMWRPAIFAGYDSRQKNYHTVGGGYWSCCIPYEENEHLKFTYKHCDDYYKNW